MLTGSRIFYALKKKSNADTTVGQIKELLQPFEYTKIDKIIDVIFATAEDVETEEIEEETSQAEARTQIRTNRELLNAKRQSAVDSLSIQLGVALRRHRQTLFWNADKSVRVCAVVSKRYERDYQPYWYAYHLTWDEFLRGGEQSYFMLVCMDRQQAYAIPLNVVQATSIT